MSILPIKKATLTDGLLKIYAINRLEGNLNADRDRKVDDGILTIAQL
jgi:hypothetical protein